MVQSTPIYMIRVYVETYDGGGSGFGSSRGYYINYYAYERPSEEFMAQYAKYNTVEEIKYVVIDELGYYLRPNPFYGEKQEENYQLMRKPVYLTFQDIVDERGSNVFRSR